MTDNETPLHTLIERAENYSKTTVKLFQLKAIDKSADVVSSLVSRAIVIMAVVLSIIILSVGASLWIGKRLDETFYGFMAIGGLYALIAILLHLFRHQWIKHPVSNSIVKQMMKQKKYENT